MLMRPRSDGGLALNLQITGLVRVERTSPLAKAADSVATGWILSKFFVEKTFSEEAKQFGDRIVSDIKVQFIKKLGGAEWMSKDVRDLGIKKGESPLPTLYEAAVCLVRKVVHQLTNYYAVHNIIQKIGYPTKSPDIRDSAGLEEYYADVNITSTGFFKNALSIAKFAIKREWSALGKPTNRDEWVMTADTVNVSGFSSRASAILPSPLIADAH